MTRKNHVGNPLAGSNSDGDFCHRKRVGLFDFDNTLVRGDSFIRFGVYALGKCRFALAVVEALPWLVAWKMGLLSSSAAKEKLFGFMFKGMDFSEFERKGKGFAAEISEMLRSDVKQEMDAMRDIGARIIVATASAEEWVRPWAIANGVDSVIGTKAEVDDKGWLTGRFSTANCRGAEKARRIQEYLTSESGPQCEIHAWGNMPDDMAMLDMADYPHSV